MAPGGAENRLPLTLYPNNPTFEGLLILDPRRSFFTKNEFLSGLGCGGGLSERKIREIFSLLKLTIRET